MSGPQNLGIPKDFRPKMGPQNQLMINVDRHGLGMSWGCYDECGSQKVVAFFFAHPWLQLWGREGFVSYISSFIKPSFLSCQSCQIWLPEAKKGKIYHVPNFFCPALARLTCHSSPKLAWQQVRAPPVMWCSLLGIMDGNGPLLLMIYLFEKVIFHRISVYQRVNSAVWVSCQFSNFF